MTKIIIFIYLLSFNTQLEADINNNDKKLNIKIIFSFCIYYIGLHVNAHKTEYMCYNQTGDISTLDGTSLKLLYTNSPT